MDFLATFLYVLIAGVQGSQGRTYHGTLPFAPRQLRNPSLVHHTAQHEVERDSDMYGTGGSTVLDMPRIIGGTEAKKHEFPGLVNLQRKGFRHWCGGSVINERWVMTAAHCCPIDSVIAADHNLKEDEDGEQHRKVESCIMHPRNNTKNDIALLKLAEPLELDGKTVSPITLPSQQANSTGDCVVMGWGMTNENGSGSDVLMKVTVPIIADEECQEMHDAQFPGLYTIYNSMICAGYKLGGKDACGGDSGDPLLCLGPDEQYYAAGIVSWGHGCARPGLPGVYTEVSYYVDWINDVINGRNTQPSHPNTVQFPFTGKGQ